MDSFMLHPMAPETAFLPRGGVSVMIVACVYSHCLPDINQSTPSEQFMKDFNIPN